MSFLNNLFKRKSDAEDRVEIHWHTLTGQADLDELITLSHEVPCMIFKHSTRCSISSVARGRLERNWIFDRVEVEAWYLDLITYRDLSNRIEAHFGVAHQSPQVILIRNGKAVYDDSHGGIRVNSLRGALLDCAG
jgi:bacillithiol system protein YtxJ